jgi:hypothetical protein
MDRHLQGRHMFKWILVIASVAAVEAQPISYGVKLGTPLNDPSQGGAV